VARKIKKKKKKKPPQQAPQRPANIAGVAQAIALQQKGHLAAAEAAYQAILQREPNNAAANHFLGILKQGQGEHQTALSLVVKSIQLSPNNAVFYCNYANLLQAAQRFDEAASHYQRAIKLAPDKPQTHYMLGNTFKALEQTDKALKAYRQALALEPQHLEALCNMGTIYKDRDQLTDALSAYDKGLAINPAHTALLSNISLVYLAQNDAPRALISCQKARTIDPTSATVTFNLGLILRDLVRIDEAIACYKQAIRIRPDYIDAHGGLSSALFIKGNLEAGWREYEWGLGKKDYRPSSRHPYPLWEGESLADKTLLVCAEQGIGDEVMFASCLPDLLAQGPKKVVVECDVRLQAVLRRSFSKISVIPRNSNTTHTAEKPAQAIDCQIAIGSLPKFYRPNLKAFPQQRGYLLPEPALLAKWQQRYAKLGRGLKIGISWRGGVDKLAKTTRSVALTQWLPLFQAKAHFVNLQYGDCHEDIAALGEKAVIHDWEDADPLKDVDDFIAQIAALDLVISIDNSTVHFAGAVGTSTWALLPFASSWRWFGEEVNSPWYPSLRLFRQQQRGDWSQVLKDIGTALANY